MPITVPAAPPETRSLVEAHLSQLGLQDLHGAAFATEAGGAAATPAPLPLWSIEISDLAAGADRALASARQIGWQYIVAVDGPAPIVEVSAGVARPAVLNLIRGGSGDKLGTTARDAEQIVDPDQNYEARVLDLRSVGQTFLWLHAARGEDKVFDLGEEGSQALDLAPVLEVAGRRAQQKIDGGVLGDAASERGGS